jgi:integrase
MSRPPEGPKLRPNKKRHGTWYIYFTDARTGRSRERSTGTRDRTEAHQIFAAWLSERDDIPVWDGPRRASQAAISDVLDMYLEQHAAEHTASPETAAASVKALLSWWGERTCDFIKPETCRLYVKARTTQSHVLSSASNHIGGDDKMVRRPIAVATAGRELTTLRAALGYAHKNGHLLDRPFVELPQRPPGRDRWLTRSEAARLLWESRREPHARHHLPLFILLGLATGARPSALFELRWTQIDFDRDRIDFNQPGRRQTSKRRPIISIPRRLRWFLLRAHARASSPYVLSYAGHKLTRVKVAFKAARIRAGLGSDVLPYTLRHTAGTWLAQAGVDLWVIGGWLGHTQARTTELYAHHAPGFMVAARKVMD